MNIEVIIRAYDSKSNVVLMHSAVYVVNRLVKGKIVLIVVFVLLFLVDVIEYDIRSLIQYLSQFHVHIFDLTVDVLLLIGQEGIDVSVFLDQCLTFQPHQRLDYLISELRQVLINMGNH